MVLNVKTVAWALGLFGIFNWIVAVVWHGFMKQPSIVGTLYPGWNFLGAKELVILFMALVIGGYVYGAVFAWIYNWTAKKFK